MKRNFLLLVMMCLLGGFGSSLLAQETVITFGETSTADGSNGSLPFTSQIAYSTTQQIFLKSELEAISPDNTIPTGKITKLEYFLKSGTETTTLYGINVYMKNTTQEKFTSTSNWDKNFSDSNLVFSGDAPLINGVLVLDLSNNPFEYDGESNIIIYFDVNSSNSSARNFKTYSAASYSSLYYRGVSNKGVDVGTWNSGTRKSFKNTTRFTFVSSGGSAETPAPTAPTLNYPSNNQENVFNPYLRFTLGSNTTHYQILMGTGTGEMTALTDWVGKTISEVDFQTSDLQPNTTYTWKVVAKNDKNDDPKTTESETRSFTTKEITAAPNEIENATPNNVEIADSNPKLEWEFAENTEDYQVVLDGEIKVNWTNKGTSTTGFYQTSNLGAGTHTWQVNTRNSAGTKTGTEYSFTVIGAPGKVTPIFPLDGATGIAEATIKFRFAESTTHYRVFFATTDDPNPSHPYMFLQPLTEDWVATNGASEMEVNVPVTLTLNKKYYWTVEVKNGAGETKYFNYVDDLTKPVYDPWTGDFWYYEQKIEPQVDVYTFTSASVLAATNVAPSNGANNLDHPTLSWKWNGEPSQYQVLLGTTNPPTDAIVDWTSDLATSYQTADLAPATKYFWRVDVKEGETVLAGDVWSFVTTLPTPEAQANPAQVVPSFGIVFGGTTINWGKIETAQGYNVYLDGVMLNDELIPTNTNYYAIPANSMKLQYNMTTGYTFNVEAVYEGLGSVRSENVIVKVTGTGFLSATIYKNDYYNRLEGATITLSCTEDEFGNTYEEGNGRQYVLTTDSNGQYLSSKEGNERIQNGTYNVVVTKDNYTSYEGELTFTNNETSELSDVILTSENLFDVSLEDVNFYSVKINLGTNKSGLYHVYRKNGNSSQEYLGELEFFINPGNESVSYVYNDWANLGKGNYLFGVSKIKDVDINWTEEVEIRNYDVFDGSGDWNTTSCWRDNVLPSENADVYVLANATIAAKTEITTGTVNIEQGGSLTINGSLTANNVNNNTGAGALCINDGGQLRQNNTNLNGKFVMNIVKGNFTVDEEGNPIPEVDEEGNPIPWNLITGWQFISSPIKNAPISQFIPANDAQGDYDLYRYDGGMWYNHKAEENNQFIDEIFVSGRAYLASLEIAETVTLSGKLNAEKTFDRQYSYTEEVENEDKLKNFFLVGNPFTFDMDLKKMTTWSNVYEGIAVVKPTGGYEYRTVNNGIVPVGDGFFIQTTGEYPSISYDENAAAKRSEKVESINIIASSKAGEDNVIINFNGKKEGGFNKLQNINDGIANIFVAKENERYGIFNCNRDVNEVTLSFIPKQMGSYSISFDIDGKFESVVLVDRLTGVETDMMTEKEYNFIATKDDRSDRFVLKLANGQQPTANSQFVYQSGEELIINAEGTIQIIDMMGRMIYSSNAENSRINVSNLKGATYIVRNITDNDVKVQKVVIY